MKSDLPSHLVKAVKGVAQGEVVLTPKVSEIVLQGFLKSGGESEKTERSQAQPTPREAEIIRFLAQGKANKEIAAALRITVRTVETHRAKIMLKLGFHSLAELVQYAIQNRMVST
ncbi:MAG TPA: response regulator transcription factor [Candidatus Dormibacteraeota bacterium]|nr:response regulator transcription factor [Candidatus Dormibacteraeota bacterium]